MVPNQKKIYRYNCPDCNSIKTDFMNINKRKCKKCGAIFISHIYKYERK